MLTVLTLDSASVSVEVVVRRQARLFLLDQRDAGRDIPPGSGRTWSGSSACRQLARSGRALPRGSPSMRSPRHTAVSRRAVSRASSSCARTARYRGLKLSIARPAFSAGNHCKHEIFLCTTLATATPKMCATTSAKVILASRPCSSPIVLSDCSPPVFASAGARLHCRLHWCLS